MTKRNILLWALCLLPYASHAQVHVKGSAFLDNWTVSAHAGSISPLKGGNTWCNMRPTYGLEFSKKITTVVSLGVHGTVMHSLSAMPNMVDAFNLTALAKFNINNLLAGYLGRPRAWEVELEGGAGWGHHFLPHSMGADDNYAVARCGINVNWFLNPKRSWAIALRPAIVCNTDGGSPHSTFQGHRIGWELRLGATYHFKNINNGKHHFTIQQPYNRPQVDALNAKINGLQQQNEQLQKENQRLRQLLQQE